MKMDIVHGSVVGTKVSGHYRQGGHPLEVAFKRGFFYCIQFLHMHGTLGSGGIARILKVLLQTGC